MKNVMYLVTFIAGAAIGAVAGITYVKKNYDISEKKEESEKASETVDEDDEPETDDDREELIRRTNNDILKSVKDPKKKEEVKDLLKEYATVTAIYGSTEPIEHEAPYVIRGDQFSEYSDYSAIELTLYADGILADDRDEIVENAEELLGKDFKSLFKEGEDELFIRNDERCTDYAIYKDLQTFETYDETRPHFNAEE